MGFGDCLMAAGTAERLYASDPALGPVVICNEDGKPRWSPLWEGNPAIYGVDTVPPTTLRRITFGGHCLPYYPPVKGPTGLVWPSAWRVRDHRPSMFLTKRERRAGWAVRDRYGPFLLVEPPGQDRKSPNRNWPASKWDACIALIQAAIPETIVQLDRPAATRLAGVPGIPHRTFREACGVLASARLTVLTEGGLSIAAGALRVPSVVLLSPCGPPVDVIGFPEHAHIEVGDDDPGTPCGHMVACAHCAAAWARLTPERVAAVVVDAIRTTARAA